MSADRGARRWLGFHLFAPEPFEPLLVGCLAPLMEAERREGRVRRFFFLRYGEGGMHLRLRVLPDRRMAGGGVDELLRARIGAWLPAGTWRLEAHRYDREALYFGETLDSVYSELLNGATSSLAFRLLAAGGARAGRWLALAALLKALLRESTDSDSSCRAALSVSLDFARDAAAVLGRPVADGLAPSSAAASAALRRALERMAGLGGDPAVRRTARLLLRCRRSAPRGAFVATHGLHLLCNKLGFTLHEEHDLFTALARLADDADGRVPTPTASSPE